ncbi:LOW QUALITY PROTEIN: gasdermin-C-like [Trichechus inunguis]
MTSMFERYVKNLLKEVGREDLKPVKSLSSATKFHQFIVIQKKKEPFLFNIAGVQKQKGDVDVEVNIGLEMSVLGEATEFQESSLEFQFLRIPPQTWTDLQKRETWKKEPAFLKECRKKRENLYVVTEIMKLTKSTMLNEMGRVIGGGKCSIPWNPYVKGQVQGEGLTVRKKMLTLPKRIVMAYQRKQLVLREDGWTILHISDDDEQNIFQDVLSDTQHDLLASVEMRTLAQQRELVRSILKPNFKYPWRIPFTLKPELLACLRGEGVAITFGLLEECGLMMAPNNPRSTWDLEAKGPVSALYTTLSVLQQLTDP